MLKEGQIIVEKAQFDALIQLNTQLQKDHKDLHNKYELLLHQLANLQRSMFGSKSERFASNNLEQLNLDLLAGQKPVEPIPVKEITYQRATQVKPKRVALPAELPRVIKDIYPEGDLTGLKYIGYDKSEKAAIRNAEIFVKEIRRHKYAKAEGQGVLIAPLPESILPKAIADYTLISYILTSKFLDHLPYYRLISMFRRWGIHINDSTLNDWQANTIDNWLVRLHERLTEIALETHYLQMDETTLKVMDKEKKGTTHTGYLWVCHAPIEKVAIFHYDKSRSSEFPKKLLEKYKGDLQTDGYAGYEFFESYPDINLIGCMVHARRYFEQALTNDKERAEYFLNHVKSLFVLEEKLLAEKAQDNEILKLRNEIAVPVLEHLHKWLKEQAFKVLPQSAIGKAVNYALVRWEKLSKYTRQPYLQMHNNLIENQIRPVSIGRKNFLFAGNHQGAKRAATMYTLFATCKLHKINPEEWLLHVLQEIPNRKANDIDDLLPHIWKPQVESVL